MRLPEPIELAACYVPAEALTNTAKHAHATVIDVQAAADEGVLRVSIRDDGGADANGGFGLLGLTDRVEALGGRISLHSPRDADTAMQVILPSPPPESIVRHASAQAGLTPFGVHRLRHTAASDMQVREREGGADDAGTQVRDDDARPLWPPVRGSAR